MSASIGSRLGSYEILSAFGIGGMGAVYLARDTKLRRNGAIKVLQGEDGTGGESGRRLLREARAAARLDHPNICAIYEVGEADGRAFIVMQLLEGETLEAHLRHGPIDVAEAAALGAEIADALGEAHTLELVSADDERHIWGDEYVRPLSEMVTLQGEIPVDISTKLRLRLERRSAARLARIDTSSAEAYQLYLKGRSAWEKWTPDGAKQAIDFFERAIAIDSNYALAGVLGLVDWNFAEAEKEYQRASPIGHLGYHYLRARRFAGAIAQYKEDRRLYPDAEQAGELGDAYYFSGTYREAVNEYVKLHRAQGTPAGELEAFTAVVSRSGITGYLRTQIDQ